jgi:hypothetical protein
MDAHDGNGPAIPAKEDADPQRYSPRHGPGNARNRRRWRFVPLSQAVRSTQAPMRLPLPIEARPQAIPAFRPRTEKTMPLDDNIRDAIVDELSRQAENSGSALKVDLSGEQLIIHGAVNIDDLVMVIAGSLAGGP